MSATALHPEGVLTACELPRWLTSSAIFVRAVAGPDRPQGAVRDGGLL